MELSSTDALIYFTSFSASECWVGSLSSTDGSLQRYNSLGSSVKECTNIILSKDSKYIYVSSTGVVSPNFLHELNSTDLSHSFTIGYISANAMDIQPINLLGNSRSVFMFTHHSSEHSTFITFTFPSTTPINAKAYACSSVCASILTGRSYVSDANVAYVNFINVNSELFLILDLLTMSLMSAFSMPIPKTSAEVTGIGAYDKISRIYTMSTHSAGTIMRIFDIAANTFVKQFETAGRTLLSSATNGGYQYFGTQKLLNNAVLHKLNYFDTIFKTSFISGGGIDISLDVTITLGTSSLSGTDESSSITIIPTSVSFATVPVFNKIDYGEYPLNYNNGSFATIYASQGTRTNLDINMACLTNSSIGLVTVMTAYYNGSASPIWVTPDPDFTGLIINAPPLIIDESTYYTATNFEYAGNTYTQYNTLVVHQ